MKTFKIVIGILCFLPFSECGLDNNIKVKYDYIQPEYSSIELAQTTDTLVFKLDSTTYPDIKSFNYFKMGTNEFIAFYDQQSQSVNIYNIKTQALEQKISLKQVFFKNPLYKTTVYCKNLDSVFVNNNKHLFLLNSKGIFDSIEFQTSPYAALASVDNTNPAIFKDNFMYAEARPRLIYTDKKDLKKWQVLYRFDLKNKSSKTIFKLPISYQGNLYSYSFFYSNYCLNNKGRFVFSFQADTNIYETDLNTFQTAFLAKSRFQKDRIQPSKIEDIQTGEGTTRAYLLSDSYGAIYFDHIRSRYLRIAQQKVNRKDYVSRKWSKKESVIFFDENFKIIGEHELDSSIISSSIFFTKEGKIYARKKIKDDHVLHFVRLEYKTLGSEQNLSSN